MSDVAPGEAAPEPRSWLRSLVRLAGLLTGDEAAAEDLAAEAAARTLVASRRKRIEDPYAYARRTLVNLVNGRGRRADVERRHAHRFVTAGVVLDPGDAVVLRLRLLDALATLSARQRAVLVLRLYEDLSEAATAEVLGVAIGTVKSLQARGLERLRELMEADET